MRTTGISTASPRDLAPLLAGAATGIAGAGAVLALTGDGSPLRGPCTLFFLTAAPAAAVAALLRGLDPFARALVSLAAAVVVDMLVAQGMLAVHRWSVRGGVVAVTVFSSAVFAAVFVHRMRRLGSRGGTRSAKVV
ncbi:hypothetical protein [Streptomyces sp. NPDC047000]|uniref:hypothetical protein n=1 Tax=Streptomyces sp. NPDC047000 TaxID=3155474 RepID=UPI0033C3236F